ncbi:MAG TPA: polysaccharide biosynthesis tyrosine autokinase [Candidatus Saccharimonadales bacterium]|jgi:succinoglycan biosynthesis transport protein ExoP|nr:polysaccharide biosynthesis tyrosine autokinase [Candidatus Saccharimonadales bacterium]
MSVDNLVPSDSGSQILRPEPAASLQPPFLAFDQSPSSAKQLSLVDYWRVLLKHKWVILACIVVVVTLAAVYSFRLTRVYEAVARISISPENSNALGLKDGKLSFAEEDAQMSLQTQASILQSDTLALTVIQKLGLQRRLWPATQAASQNQGDNIYLTGAPKLDPKQEARLISAFQSGLKVAPVPGTSILEIHFASSDPALAAETVNSLVDTYLQHNMKSHVDATTQAAEWLSRELADLQIKVETGEEKLVQYQKEHEIIGIDEKQNITTSKLDALNRELTTAEAERIQKQAVYEFSLPANQDSIGLIVESDYLKKLQVEQHDLEDQLAQLTLKFGPAFPKVIELQLRIRQLQVTIESESQRVLAKVKNDYLGALEREKMLHAAFDKQKQEANTLNENAIQYTLLKRDAESNRQLYEGLLQKLKEASISAGLNSNNIRVVDSARVPINPTQPNIPRNLKMSLLLGLVTGIGLAFLLENLDTTVRTSEQAEIIAAVPSLALIPLQSHLRGKVKPSHSLLAFAAQNGNQHEPVALVAYAHPGSQLAESYRTLRTSILLSSLGAPPKTILVTSPLPGEGKTTTSINSAMVLAQQGRRVLLVEADLRRPCMRHLLEIEAVGGLSNLLTGGDVPGQFIVPSMQPSLFVLPAGPKPPHPAELLGSALMKQLLHQWSQEYDHVIIDTPPLLSVTDATFLSAAVNAVLLVVRTGVTSKAALRRAKDLLFQVNAKLMGVVINAVDLKSHDYYYHYYSSAKYGSYYRDSEDEDSVENLNVANK